MSICNDNGHGHEVSDILVSLDYPVTALWIKNGVSPGDKFLHPSYDLNRRKDGDLFFSYIHFTAGLVFAQVCSVESSNYEPFYDYRFAFGEGIDSSGVMRGALRFRLDYRSGFYVPI